MVAKLEKRRLCGSCKNFQPTGETIRQGTHYREVGVCGCVAGSTRLVHRRQVCPFGMEDEPLPADTTKGNLHALSRIHVPHY